MGYAQGPPGLLYLSAGDLIAAAGGDPWAVNKSLQDGDPGEIVLGPPGALLLGAIGSLFWRQARRAGRRAMYNWATK